MVTKRDGNKRYNEHAVLLLIKINFKEKQKNETDPETYREKRNSGRQKEQNRSKMKREGRQ